MAETASQPDDLPAASPELVLIRVFVQAYIATAHEKPRRRARAFLHRASTILADEESVSMLLPIRPAAAHAEVSRARRQALAMFRQLVPALTAELPWEGEG